MLTARRHKNVKTQAKLNSLVRQFSFAAQLDLHQIDYPKNVGPTLDRVEALSPIIPFDYLPFGFLLRPFRTAPFKFYPLCLGFQSLIKIMKHKKIF